jgi:hypothetical protein
LASASSPLREHPRSGYQLVPPHFLRKTRQFSRAFVELAPPDKSAAPVLPADIAELGQFLERPPQGDLADLVQLRKFGFVGELFVGPPLAGFKLRFQHGLKLMV